MKWEGRAIVDDAIDAGALVREVGADILSHEVYLSQAELKQHGFSNSLRHQVGVAVSCVKAAQRLGIAVDVRSLIRGALLHDFYLYQYTKTHTKGHFHHHGEWAAQNAEKYFGINALEKNMIECHMWPIAFWRLPKSREAFLLTIEDKIVGLKEFLHFRKIA